MKDILPWIALILVIEGFFCPIRDIILAFKSPKEKEKE